ncbi:retrovirus-related pol polyprotein from transposon TNT 1-94 [Tanacetum coccineum]
MSIPVTAEEKKNKKNDVKARCLLLMALPNEHQLTFSQYPDAKPMFVAIETRFRGNATTKKTQKTLLKQQYENFSASSAESLDSIFNRLQKIVSRLAILGVVIVQEDLNSNFLSSLPHEWNTNVVVWMNKPEVETISIDDLYNNFKIVKQKVKKSVGTSGAQNMAFMTAPSTSSTNDANTASPQVSIASPNVNVASPQVSTASVSDNAVYAFMVENLNGSNVLHQDLEQIHEDDLEAMDLKWQLSLLSVRANKYYQRTGKKIFINANDTAGFDKTKKSRQHQKARKNEDKSLKAMLAIDGVGFDWSDMAEEQVQTNMALMAFLDSEFIAATYKRGLATVEEQLIKYRKNEVLFSEEVAVLKREVACKDYEINMLKRKWLFPPHPLIYNRPNKLDLSYSGLDEFKEPEFKGYGPKNSEQESNVINCDNHQRKGIVSRNNYKKVDAKTTHPSVHRNMSPRAVLLKTSLTPLNIVRPVNTCSTGKPNIQAVHNFKEFDGGYIAFGGDVYFVNELNFNLFSVSQMCDKKNYVLFTDTECLVLSPNFKLPDESQILLKIPRKDNMYSFDMKNIVPKESLTCLVAKATLDESMLWHRRLGHINFKNINKLVKDNLVRGLPTKRFENDQTCVACLKGKQHRASCKSKVLNPITKPLFMLHMDLFGPTFVSSLMHKKYCLVVTDDYSRFTWVFFLATKDETSEILKNFIKEIENLVDKKVKIIRCDNGTEFKNKVMDDFCREKGIRREYSVARTPQQNGVAERRNRTLIEAARTMLADSKLPTTFWAEAVSTACYVQNRVLVVKPHNKTPYELFRGLKPALNFMRPFGCHVTILNTLDNLGKFDGKSDEVAAGTISNESVDASYFDSPSKDKENVEYGPDNENDEKDKSEDDSSPKEVNTAGQHVNTTSPKVNTGRFKLNTVDPSVNTASSNDQDSLKDMFTMGASHTLEATHVVFFSDEDKPEVDLGNILNSYTVSTTPNIKIHKDYPIKNVIGDVKSSIQTRIMTKPTSEQGFLSVEELLQFNIQQVWILVNLPTSKRAIRTKWVFRNKKDKRGIVIRNKARLVAHGHRQEEGINYEEVFALVARVKAIRLFLSYASFMGFLVYNMDVKSAFLYITIKEEVYVTQPPGFKDPDNPNKVYKVVKALYGLHQALRAWYETLPNYLLGNESKRGKIDQTLFIKKQKGDILLVYVYVDDFIFGSRNKELCISFEKLLKDNQDKYVDEILKKFNYTDVKSASTPVDLEKPLVKDGDANDVDVHLYRSMIGSLMYLTASRPDIMFVVCACARFQVTPKTSHLLAVKRIFRYLKGKPTLGLWYSRDSLFELVAYTDSDYAGATQDRKSTTGGCQFLGNRLISWQCKKQTVVATSITKAEYVVAASCYGQVL